MTMVHDDNYCHGCWSLGVELLAKNARIAELERDPTIWISKGDFDHLQKHSDAAHQKVAELKADAEKMMANIDDRVARSNYQHARIAELKVENETLLAQLGGANDEIEAMQAELAHYQEPRE